jgi:anhydro-N-acetylmuramic acid kinase
LLDFFVALCTLFSFAKPLRIGEAEGKSTKSVNPQIKKLYHIAQQPSRMILGLMSGTSMDGLDMALCRFTGRGTETTCELVHFDSLPFDETFKASIRAVFAQENIHFPSLSTLNAQIARTHAAIVLATLKSWGIKPNDVDIIASHGQTVMHRPDRSGKMPHSTLQIGDGDHLAHLTGIITLADFRQKHVAAGGEGAPLAMFGDYFLFTKAGEERILLNIGGIGNFTYLPADQNASHIVVSDTGPGNTLLDAYVRKNYRGMNFDVDAQIARSGKIHAEFLQKLMRLPFFNEPFPKSTGPEYFNLERISELAPLDLSPADFLATLTRFTAESIALAIQSYTGLSRGHVYVSGGGARNPLLLEHLKNLLPGFTVQDSHVLGIDCAAKEAVLFALLANETLMDPEPSSERRLGDSPWVTMGKISLPN